MKHPSDATTLFLSQTNPQRESMSKALAVLILLTTSLAHADTYVVSFNSMNTNEGKQVANALRRLAPKPVHVRYLHDRNATHQNFVQSLKWLKKKVTANDVVVLYLAGHGSTEGKQGFFLTTRGRSIRAKEVRDATETLPGTCLVLFDSCQSGGALRESWKKTTVVCSSLAREVSWTDVMSKAVCEIMRQGREVLSIVVDEDFIRRRPLA
jgi:hypothetical protein